MNIKIYKKKDKLVASISYYEEDTPKEIKIQLQADSIPQLVNKLQDPISEYFKPRT